MWCMSDIRAHHFTDHVCRRAALMRQFPSLARAANVCRQQSNQILFNVTRVALAERLSSK